MVNRQRARESRAAFKQERAKFRGGVSTVSRERIQVHPMYQRVSAPKVSKPYQKVTYHRYYETRTNYYRTHNWSAPEYVYRSRSSFGVWDAMVFWMMLDALDDRDQYALAYHHRNDSGYREWRREATRMAHENVDLRRKLAKLDKRVATMEGTAEDKTYLPAGMDPTVALAAEIIADDGAIKLQLATGPARGHYHQFGMKLRRELSEDGITVILAETAGSKANMEGMLAMEYDAVITQSDVLDTYVKYDPEQIPASLQATLYQEYIHLLVHKNSCITSLKDLDPERHTLYLGPKNSGASQSWEGFVHYNPTYEAFTKIRYADTHVALDLVAVDPNSVILSVSGLNTDLLQTAEEYYDHRVQIAAVDDWDFVAIKDRFDNDVYRFRTMEPSNNLLIETPRETLTVGAVFLLSEAWEHQHGPEARALVEKAMWHAIEHIETKIGVH